MNPVWSALANGAILSVPLAAVLWLGLRLTPRRALNAATRYVIWWIALVMTIVLPGVYLGSHAPRSAASAPVDSAAVRVVELAPQPDRPLAPSVPSDRPHLPMELLAGPWLRWLLAAWIFASAISLLRLVLSYAAISRLAGRATDALPEWGRIAGAGGRTIRVARSVEIPIPVATGPFRPSILIPATLFDHLTEDDLRQVGLHEAAHLARRDDYALLMERFLEAVFSLHPVVRWIARRIDLEREIACDDLVAEATGQPHRYADCLTRVMALCGPVRRTVAAAHAAGSRSHFSQRVELLIDQARDTRTRPFAARLLAIAAALLALTCILARTPELLALTTPHKETLMTHRTKLAVAAMAAVAAAQPARPQSQAQMQEPIPAQSQPQVAAATGRRLVLFFDTSMLSTYLVRAIAAAQKFVEAQLKSEDQVAVMMAAPEIKVLQDFTGDHDLLRKAILQLNDVPVSGISESPASREAATVQSNLQLANLESVVRLLGPVAGKKALVYFGISTTGSGSEAQLQSTVNAAVRANVSFYPIDVRGPIAQPGH